MSLLFSSARLIASFIDNDTVSAPTPRRGRLGTGGSGFAWKVGITGSRNGSDGTLEPPGTVPAGGVANGVACGVAIPPGGAVGLVCCVPGGADGFCAGVVVPGIGSVPGGLVGSLGAGVGRGVERGTCATAAFTPANTMHARTAWRTKSRAKLRDIRLNIRRRAP